MEIGTLLDYPWALGLITAVVLSGAIEAGYQLAMHSGIQENAHRKEQMLAIRDGLFVLLSFLLGFTLALAAPRYNDRRSLLIDEADAIGTTYLRAGTLPSQYREQVQQLLRQYVDARLELDNAGLERSRMTQAVDRSKEIQERLWQGVIEITKNDRSSVTGMYMSSLNQMIDLHEKRISGLENRIPRAVWYLIFSVAIIAALTRGLTIGRRFWLTLILVPLTIAIIVALVADLDTPSSGLIRLDHGAMMRLKADISSTP
jgi:hypothetical protein